MENRRMLVGSTRCLGAVWLMALSCMSYVGGVRPIHRQRSWMDTIDPVWLGAVATVFALSIVWAAVLVLDHAAVCVLVSALLGAFVGTMLMSVGLVAQQPDGFYPAILFLVYAVFLALPLGLGAVIGAAVRAVRTRRVGATGHSDPDE